MITVGNDTDEDYVIDFTLDESAPGCRVLKVPERTWLPAKSRAILLGYEPGVLLCIRPMANADLPRTLTRKD